MHRKTKPTKEPQLKKGALTIQNNANGIITKGLRNRGQGLEGNMKSNDGSLWRDPYLWHVASLLTLDPMLFDHSCRVKPLKVFSLVGRKNKLSAGFIVLATNTYKFQLNLVFNVSPTRQPAQTHQ